MEQPPINGSLVRKYLLGEVGEDERERIEVGLLTSDSFYETLTALEDEVEDELIDQYVGGELSERERERFEHIFLTTPERTKKLRLVLDLNERAALTPAARVAHAAAATVDPVTTARPAVGRESWWQRFSAFGIFQNPLVGFSCAVALLVSLFCGILLLIRAERLEAQLTQLQARGNASPTPDAALKEQLDQLRARNEELSADFERAEEQRVKLEREVASLKTAGAENPATPRPSGTPSAGTPVYAVLLTPTMRSGSGDERPAILELSVNATSARLLMDLRDIDPKAYASFRAIVGTDGGAEVLTSNRVSVIKRGGRRRAAVTLPARRLPQGQYTVELRGVTADGTAEPIGLYSLQVITK